MKNKCSAKIVTVAISALMIFSLISIMAVAPASAQNETEKQVTILHINDSHAYFLPLGEGIGGAAYVAGYVNSVREMYPSEVLFLNAGDDIDGGPIGDQTVDGQKGMPIPYVLNAMGIDVSVLGNHELEHAFYEDGFMEHYLSEAEFSVLGANVENADWVDMIEPYVIVNINGVDIGIIGVTNRYYKFTEPFATDPIAAVEKYVEELEPITDVIVVLSHLGYPKPPYATHDDMAAIDGVNFVIGGHAHVVDEMYQYDEDTWQVGEAGWYLQWIGDLRFTIDLDTGEITEVEHTLVKNEHPPLTADADVVDVLDEWDAVLMEAHPEYANIVVVLDQPLGEEGYPHDELQAMAAALMSVDDDEIGFANYGWARMPIYPGTVMYRNLVWTFPFGETLARYSVQGWALKEMLFPVGVPVGAYQVDGQWYLESGELIEDAEWYRLATNHYAGPMFFDIGWDFEIDQPYIEVVEDSKMLARDALADWLLLEYPLPLEVGENKFYQTIQSAINAALPGDTVLVYPGTYEENINIDKSLTVRSVEGAKNTIINAQEAEFAVLINGKNTVATFDGFTVDNYDTVGILAGAFRDELQGVLLGDDPVEVHILNNIVKPPTIKPPHNNNIQVGDGTTGTIIGNEVSGAFLESPDWTGSGILVAGSSNVLVSNNYAHDCESGIVIAGYAEYRDAPAVNNIIENNLVENSGTGIAIQMNSIGTIIRYNDVSSNDVGIESVGNISWEPTIPSGTEIHYNNIVGNEYGVKSSVWDENLGWAEQVDATYNWWGTVDIVFILNSVEGKVYADPWLDASYPGGEPVSFIGPEGPQGKQGETGETGSEGPEGPESDKGDTGAKGDKGATGSEGLAGESAPIEVVWASIAVAIIALIIAFVAIARKS